MANIIVPEKTNYLICDDYQSMRNLVKSELRSYNMTGKMYEGENGNEGYKVLIETVDTEMAVQFIICDMVMPEASGIDLLKKVRAHDQLKDVPFLMLTSESDRDTVMEALKEGTSNYLLKPWNKASFKEKLEFCWKKHMT